MVAVKDIRLRAGAASPADVTLRPIPTFPLNILLLPALANNKDIQLTAAFEYQPQVTSYANFGGTGRRTGEFDITQNLTLGGTGIVLNAINGVFSADATGSFFWNGGQTGGIVMFDWGPGARICIDEFKWYQDIAASQGTWVIEGSNNVADWLQLGVSFILGSPNATMTYAFPNSTGYRAYRLRQISGTSNAAPFVEEIEFKLLDLTPQASRPSIGNAFGRGDRTAGASIIAVSTPTPLGGGSTIDNLVDGDVGVTPPLTVVGTNTGNSTPGTTAMSYAVPLPAGITSGDLLLVFVATCGAGAGVTSTPSGWTNLFRKALTAPADELACYYKVAGGAEGATVTISSSQLQNWATNSYRITGYSGTPEAGTATAGLSTAPDPPSLSPSWGSAATLWLAVEGDRDTTNTDPTVPVNYTNTLTANVNDAGTIRARCTSVRRFNTTATEDPAPFTLAASNQWGANTVAIRPAITGASSSNGCFFSPATTSASITFDFTSTVVINGFLWRMSSPQAQGTWVLEGSNDNSIYTGIGNSFTLGGATENPYFFYGFDPTTATAYRYYRLRQTGGTTDVLPFYLEIEFRVFTSTPTTTGGAGSSAGTSSVTAVGVAVIPGDGSSTGLGTATAVGVAVIPGAGSSAGIATVTAVGVAVIPGAGASAGVATVTAVGVAVIPGAGASAGIATATAVGVAVIPGAGASTGVATATAVGVAVIPGVGSSTGVGTATAVGVAVIPGVGSSTGVATATAVGAAVIPGVGASAGVGAATAVGAAVIPGVGASAGIATAAAVGRAVIPGAGNAAGVAAAAAVGVIIIPAVGNAAGTSTATAVGQNGANAGSAAGTSTAAAVGVIIIPAVGSAAGTSTVNALGVDGNARTTPNSTTIVLLPNLSVTALLSNAGFVVLVPSFIVNASLPLTTQSVNLPQLTQTLLLSDRVVIIKLFT